jgi:hypothetical protein
MIIFAFSINQTTNEAVFSGNIDIQQALQLLQQLAIIDAVQKAKQETGQKQETSDTISKDGEQ